MITINSEAVIINIQDQFTQALRTVLADEAASLPEGAFVWEVPKDASFGDLSNPISFRLAALKRAPPLKVAQELADKLLEQCRHQRIDCQIDRIEARVGFVNIFLSDQTLIEMLQQILQQKDKYGLRKQKNAQSINIEFVSANPTGPLSLAHGRQAAVGDALARIMRSQGYEVTAEYYLNDEGRQIEMLGKSLRARCFELLGKDEPVPEGGYHGSYVIDTAKRLIESNTNIDEKPLEYFIEIAVNEQLNEIKKVLSRFGLTFDTWTSQRWLTTSGRLKAGLDRLQQLGVLYEDEGAQWFASSKYGDDKDRVIKKSNGDLTYLAPDIAYHQYKFERGFNKVINLWGPDHHGYIARVKAAVSALGLPADHLIIRIVQLVSLSRAGKVVPMSKREGEFVSFSDVLDEVGVDATRFFLLMRTMESHLEFDLDLAKTQSQENPVYYIQYAHARICSILSKVDESTATKEGDLSTLKAVEERLLMRMLFQYPLILWICSRSLEPHGLTVYLRKLAESFHVFYTKHRVISDDPVKTSARMELVRAVSQVIANGLGTLGVSAPQHM